MRLAGYDIAILEVPLQAGAAAATSRSLLVRLRDGLGHQGWGECPVPPGTPDELRNALRGDILPTIASGSFGEPGSIAQASATLLERLPREAFGAVCAAETALLDLNGRQHGKSAGDAVGPPYRRSVHYAGLIAGGDAGCVRDQAIAMRRQAVRRVTVQVGADPYAAVGSVEMVREILGEDVELIISVDGAWDPGLAIRQLRAMAPFRLSGVADPVPEDDLEGMATVTAAGLAPVIAGDSVQTSHDVLRLAATGACDAISIRISRCGGLTNARHVHRVAREASLGCQLGAETIDAGLLTAAGRLFAGRAEGLRWCAAPPLGGMAAEPIVEPPMAVDLSQPAAVQTGPGLGVRVLEEAVARITTQRVSVG